MRTIQTLKALFKGAINHIATPFRPWAEWEDRYYREFIQAPTEPTMTTCSICGITPPIGAECLVCEEPHKDYSRPILMSAIEAQWEREMRNKYVSNEDTSANEAASSGPNRVCPVCGLHTHHKTCWHPNCGATTIRDYRHV